MAGAGDPILTDRINGKKRIGGVIMELSKPVWENQNVDILAYAFSARGLIFCIFSIIISIIFSAPLVRCGGGLGY